MAPAAGLEPATSKLTASCSTTELRRIIGAAGWLGFSGAVSENARLYYTAHTRGSQAFHIGARATHLLHHLGEFYAHSIIGTLKPKHLQGAD